jgi:uncharacterized protein YggE
MQKHLLTAVLVCLSAIGICQDKNFIDQPYIEVSGSSDTLVTPNEIFIRIVLSEKDTRDRTSIEELEQKMVDKLKNLGVDTEKELTTSDITSNFRFYLLKGKEVLKTKLYLLKVSDAVTASKVFLNLEEIGISNMAIDRVDHSELEKLKNRMRSNAVVDARNRAVAMTQPLNQTVAAAIHISDTENISQLQGRVAGIQIRGTNSGPRSQVDLPQIEFEKIRITANINVKFILK